MGQGGIYFLLTQVAGLKHLWQLYPGLGQTQESMSRLVDSLRSYFRSTEADCPDDYISASHCLCVLPSCHSAEFNI